MREPAGVMPRTALLLLLAVCPPPAAGAGADALTVLITNPRASELRNFVVLVERGLLEVPGLRLLGVYHAGERESYDDARAYIAGQGIGWIELREISCALDQESLYRENRCTRTFRELFSSSRGAIFTGGADIPPAFYGEKTLLTTVIEDPSRHLLEISLLFHLLGSSRNLEFRPFLRERPDYVVLGLCLGMQSMNVAAGGTLIQDIPSQVYAVWTFEEGLELPADRRHRSFSRPLDPAPDVGAATVHQIRFVAPSDLAPKGHRVKVVSIHHQALGKLGAGLEVLATSLDGKIVEAVRHRSFPGVLGVQFHPEKSLLWEPDTLYRQEPGAGVANYLAEWFGKDRRARDFHRAFWRFLGALLLKRPQGP